MCFLNNLHDLNVHLRQGGLAAGQGSVAAQIRVMDSLHPHHAEFFRHAETGHHGPGQTGGLLNIVGGAGGHVVEHHFFRSPAAGKGHNLGKQVFLGIIQFLLFVHLHGVTQGTVGMGNDRNLFHRGAVGLAGRHQRVPDFMIRGILLFLFGNHHVLALIPGDNDIHRLLQVGVGHFVPVVAHGAQGRFIDDVGQFRAAGAGGGACNLLQIHIVLHLHVFGMNFQY